MLVRLLFLMAICLPTIALTHPQHTTATEITYAEEPRRLEVSMELATEDLVLLHSGWADSAALFAVSEDARNKAFAGSLQKLFRVSAVTNESNVQEKLTWVGHELGPVKSYFYFVIELAGVRSKLNLSNDVLIEDVPGQINSVVLKGAGPRQSALFSKENRTSVFRLPIDE